MKDQDRILLRLKSCLRTILDAQNDLGVGFLDPALAEQFKVLENTLQSVDLIGVTEREICMVEDAVNRLLRELAALSSKTETAGLAAIN